MSFLRRFGNAKGSVRGSFFFVCACIIWVGCILLLEGADMQIRITAATLLAGVFLWVLSPFSLSFTSFLIIVVLMLTKVIPLETGLGGFSSGSVFLVLSGLMFAQAIKETDLAERTAYFVLGRFGGTPKGVLAGLMIILQVLGFFVPSSTVRITLLLPTVQTIIKNARNERGVSNISKLLILGLAFGGTITGSGVLPAAFSNIITVDLLQELTGTRILYSEWLRYIFPIGLVLLPFAWFTLLKTFPPEIAEFPGGAEEFRRRGSQMGPLGTKEKKCILILCLTLFLWLTEGWHGLHTAVPSMLAVILFGLPGIGFMEWKTMLDVDWGTIVLIGFTLSLGTALNSTGTANFLANGIFDWTLGGLPVSLSPVLAVFLITAFTQVIHIFVGNVTTLLVSLIPIMVEVAIRLNVDPMLAGVVTGVTGLFGFLLPVETVTNIVAFGTGYLRPTDMLKPGIWITIASIIVLTLAAYFYWPLIGLI
ncbi:MAG: SLC13 family permease [Bacillota bacterium]